MAMAASSRHTSGNARRERRVQTICSGATRLTGRARIVVESSAVIKLNSQKHLRGIWRLMSSRRWRLLGGALLALVLLALFFRGVDWSGPGRRLPGAPTTSTSPASWR